MFTFGFSKEESTEALENQKTNEPQNKKADLTWFPAKKVEIPDELLGDNFTSVEAVKTDITPQLSLLLVCPKNIQCENIIEAETQHSDLLPAKYEGGLKIWECTHDLANYVLNENIDFEDKSVLDLGCGAGVLGLLSLAHGATVHFQDYNTEVLESLTIPNVFLNAGDPKVATESCQFYSGDWQSFPELIPDQYDVILTSETIYNPDNHRKLYEIIKRKLKDGGIGLVAGKTYYFGVGGSMRQFEELVKSDGVFDGTIVWKSSEGIQREILQLKKKPMHQTNESKSPSP